MSDYTEKARTEARLAALEARIRLLEEWIATTERQAEAAHKILTRRGKDGNA